MKKLLFISGLLFILTGCGQDQLIGTWVQPIPGKETEMQGIKLEPNGVASSVNMNTLVYKSWKREDNLLHLSGKSIGNGEVIDIEEEFEIKQLDKENLVLQIGTVTYTLTRQ